MITKELENETVGQEARLGSCMLWFFWGVSMSFMTILSLMLLILLAVSVTLNVYLGWELSGFELTVSRPGPGATETFLPIPTGVLAGIPTNTPELVPTSTPTPALIDSPLGSQFATLAAIATEVAARPLGSSPESIVPAAPLTPQISPPEAIAPPTVVPAAVAIATPASQSDTSNQETTGAGERESAEASTALAASTPAAVVGESQEFTAPATSANSYTLIPINGERDRRPAEEHGDLNLKLREPQPIEVDLSLVDVGAGVDPNAPNFGKVFKPNIVAAYTIHNWNWECNCKGDLIQDGSAVLAGIKTNPGDPIFIPAKGQDIFGGKFYATLLYASEDSLTFVYAREGTLAKGYSVHYLGLQTDPNLLALFRESQGNELPGLSLDTPVGTATDELIVAIRDNGKFLDTRSKNDWWN